MVEIILGVVMFTGVVLALCVFILLARAKLVPSGEVNIEINDDPEKTIEVRPGTKLLGALAEKEIYVPSACGGGGSCGQCKCKVLKAAEIFCPLKLPMSASAKPAKAFVLPVRSMSNRI